MQSQRKAYIYAAITVVFWSTSASVFKICLSEEHLSIGVLPLLFWASAFSTAAYSIYLLITGRLGRLKAVSRRDVLRSAGLGFLNPFLYYTVLLKAYSLLPAQQAQPLNFLWPIALVLLSIPLLGQKIGARDVAAIALSFFGVLVVSTEGDVLGLRFTNGTGAMLAVGSTVVWALYWIYNAKDGLDACVRLLLNFAFGTLYVFVAMTASGAAEVPGGKGLLGAAYIGLFETGITFLLWLKTLRLSEKTAHVANLIFLVPFLSLIVIFLVLGERILPATVVGLVLIVGGIVIQKL